MAENTKYLTGDGAAIKEFLDKFDVRYFGQEIHIYAFANNLNLFSKYRHFCSIVMVSVFAHFQLLIK